MSRKDDLTVVVYGRNGVGKSALIGEIADFLSAHQCTVRCVEGPAGGEKVPVRTPDPGHFAGRPLKVRIVEQWIDRQGH